MCEIEVVVEDLAGVVEEGAGGFSHYLFKRQLLQARGGEEFVEVVDVGLKVLAVMELKGAGADDRHKGVLGIW